MIFDPGKARIFVRPGQTDLRKAVNGLAGIIERHMSGEPFSGNVYEIEKRLREENPDESKFLENRKEEAEPVLAEFKAWLEQQAIDVLPSSQLGKAVTYTLKQWDKLAAYLESPHLTPDNNACENAVRPFVLGRKNWLFNKSPEGAKSSCGIFTLIETAKQNGIEPLVYLRTLFEKAPYASTPENWEKLLPWNIFTA